MKKLLTILFLLLSTYAYSAQCGFIAGEYYCLPSINSTSINWNSLNQDIQRSGVNWNSLVNNIRSAAVNGYPLMNTGGINWQSIKNSELSSNGINWNNIPKSDLFKITGVNWNAISIP